MVEGRTLEDPSPDLEETVPLVVVSAVTLQRHRCRDTPRLPGHRKGIVVSRSRLRQEPPPPRRRRAQRHKPDEHDTGADEVVMATYVNEQICEICYQYVIMNTVVARSGVGGERNIQY